MWRAQTGRLIPPQLDVCLRLQPSHPVLATRAAQSAQHVALFSTNALLATEASTTHHDKIALRNIGIVAHVDAGKTSVTERILHSAGVTARPGRVDDGTALTDFLPQERARGITIQAAAVSFSWPPAAPRAAITLVDTPGHVDFSHEVACTLPVLDAAVVVLDAVAGVQAQTRAVWRLAESLPRLALVNKIDRDAAISCLAKTTAALRALAAPLPVLPLQSWRGGLTVNCLVSRPQTKDIEPHDLATLAQARRELIEQLCSLDDEFMKTYLAYLESNLTPGEGAVNADTETRLALSYPEAPLAAAIARAFRAKNAIPLLYASAMRGVGITALLDAVANYFPPPPSPQESQQLATTNKRNTCSATFERSKHQRVNSSVKTCAFVFKVRYDANSASFIAFVRVYGEPLLCGHELLNSATGRVERVQRLYCVFADKTENVFSLRHGQIGAVHGLRDARTGHLLLGIHASLGGKAAASGWASATQDKKCKEGAINSVPSVEFDAGAAFGAPRLAPPPPALVTRTVIPLQESELKRIQEFLSRTCVEDPSFSYRDDPETGQFLVFGTGELHLEILEDRLRDVCPGTRLSQSVLVAYRECLLDSLALPLRKGLDYPVESNGNEPHDLINSNALESVLPGFIAIQKTSLSKSIDTVGCPVAFEGRHQLSPAMRRASTRAVSVALSTGTLRGYPLTGVAATIHTDSAPRQSCSPDRFAQLCATAAREAIVNNTTLAEPCVRVTVRGLDYEGCPRNATGRVAAELSLRGAEIEQVLSGTVEARASVAALIGFHRFLRAASAGVATLEQTMCGYSPKN